MASTESEDDRSTQEVKRDIAKAEDQLVKMRQQMVKGVEVLGSQMLTDDIRGSREVGEEKPGEGGGTERMAAPASVESVQVAETPEDNIVAESDEELFSTPEEPKPKRRVCFLFT